MQALNAELAESVETLALLNYTLLPLPSLPSSYVLYVTSPNQGLPTYLMTSFIQRFTARYKLHDLIDSVHFLLR